MSGQVALPGQELLLRAALGDRDEVERSWRTWSSAYELDDVEPSSARLLPLVYLSLERHGIDDPALGRLKGLHRYAWVANQRRFRVASDALDVLAAAEIATAPIKGLALVERVYPGAGARPMDDVDILVPPSGRAAAWRALREDGWEPASGYYDVTLPESRLPYLSGVNLRRPDSPLEIDLHWHAIPFAEDDDDFWRAAQPAEVLGRSTHLLSPTHELLIALRHGAKWDSPPPVRWIPDAMLLLRAYEVDWDELCRQARKRNIVLIVLHGLRYLRETFAAPIPDTVVRELAATPVAPFERRVYRARARQTGKLHGLAHHRDHYRQLSGPWPVWRRVTTFPTYLRDWWGLDSTWRVPAEAVRRVRLGPEPPS